MILVDTSIWADHIGLDDPTMTRLLQVDDVLMHPFVLGELALGNLRDRGLLVDLRDLTHAIVAEDTEVQAMIEHHELFGTGIGYVDTHLLASTLLTADARIWTRDKRLRAAAVRLGVDTKLDQ